MNKKIQKYINICFFTYLSIKSFLWYENSNLQLTKYDYFLNEKYKDLKDLKIVQISDLHDKSFGFNQFFLLNKIKKLSPDLILTTGDMSNLINTKNCLILFKGLTKLAPTYYITGNHEEVKGEVLINRLVNKLKNIGVKCLINDTGSFYFNNCKLNLIGLKSCNLSFLNISNLDDNFNILLTHEPQEVYKYCSYFNIAFSGHTHGAQWRIPILDKGIFAPDQGIFPKYDAGKYNLGNSVLYINRGLGNETIIPRINNRPEIIEITFKYKKK